MIYKVKSQYKDYLWGGTNLKDKYNVKTDLTIVAEAWLFSTHKDGNDSKLVEIVNNAPYLTKVLDSKEALSVQVHPHDEMANILENDNGKSEVWYILDHQPGAFIYLGLNQVTTKEVLQQAIENGNLTDYLNKIEVKKGDFFYIEAGTIHALGAGITALEVQQSSNSTYRLYDYKRVGADGLERELHLEKGLNAIDYSKINLTSDKLVKIDDNSQLLIDCPYFRVVKYNISKNTTLSFNKDKVNSIVVLSGDGMIENNSLEILDTYLITDESLEIKTDSNLEFVVVEK